MVIWRWCLLLMMVAAPSLARATTLTLWHSYRGAEEEALQQAAERYEAISDDSVSLVAVPFGSFDAKLETAVPRGNGPDLFIAPQGSLGKWVGFGLLQPLSTTPVGHRPVTIEALLYHDQAYGVPLAFKSLLLLYDPLVVTSPPETTDELFELARSLNDPATGRYGLAWQAAEPYFHAPFMYGFGVGTHDEQGVVDLDRSEHAAALALSAALAGIGPVRPTGERISQLYRDGDAAMVISGPWFTADIERPIAAAPLPIVSATGEPARPYLTVDGGFVAEGSRNREDGEAFLHWLGGPEGAEIRMEVGGQAVSCSSVELETPLLKALADQAESAVPLPTSPEISAAWEALGRALRRTQRGAASPEAAVSEAQAYFDVLNRPPAEPANPLPYLLALAMLLLGGGVMMGRKLNAATRAKIRTHWKDYVWILPASIAVLLLVAVPFVLGASVSLFAHEQGEWTFVGLSHFADIILSRDWPLTSPMSFFYTLGVTVLWTTTNLALHVGIGVALALLLREPWIKMSGGFRALLILPWAVPNYITALIWRTMFDAQYGAINAALSAVLGRPVEFDWFGSFSAAFAANLATNTWLGFPFMMVVTLGVLASIPSDLEEAAWVDGASYIERFKLIIWPLLKPALLPAIILGSVWTFNMFNVIYLVSAGEPDGSTEILISEAYRWAFSRGNRYGYAAAYAVLIFLVLVVYSRWAATLTKRRVL